MHNCGELVDASLLVADLEDADLRLRHSSKVARLDVRLVLTVAVASRGTAAHLEYVW